MRPLKVVETEIIQYACEYGAVAAIEVTNGINNECTTKTQSALDSIGWPAYLLRRRANHMQGTFPYEPDQVQLIAGIAYTHTNDLPTGEMGIDFALQIPKLDSAGVNQALKTMLSIGMFSEGARYCMEYALTQNGTDPTDFLYGTQEFLARLREKRAGVTNLEARIDSFLRELAVVRGHLLEVYVQNLLRSTILNLGEKALVTYRCQQYQYPRRTQRARTNRATQSGKRYRTRTVKSEADLIFICQPEALWNAIESLHSPPSVEVQIFEPKS